MTELIFPRRPGERISHDSRSSDAAKAWCDRSECAFQSVVRPRAARALRAGLVLVSALGALSVAAGNAHGQPTPARLGAAGELRIRDRTVSSSPSRAPQRLKARSAIP